MIYKFNEEKSSKLLKERGISFQDIINATENYQSILAIKEHPNKQCYPNQQVMYIELNEVVYVVPFVKESDGALFLKTIYPSTKARKLFLAKNNPAK